MPSLRKQRVSWCLFDFANSAFNTVVVTFVFSAFFARALAPDPATGDAMWGWTVAIAAICVALLSPVLGARANRTANKKAWLIGSSLLTIFATAGLFWFEPGQQTPIWLICGVVVVAMTAFEIAFVFYNAYLPELASPREMGRLSGNAWALGYLGGLLCLVAALGLIQWLPEENGLAVRSTNLLVAAWFLVFALPAFLFLRDRPKPASATAGTVEKGSSVGDVLATIKDLPNHPALFRFLIARLIYNDATLAVIGLAALYMSETLQMEIDEILIAGIVLNVAAGLGAFGFGRLDDKFGPKAAVQWSLVLLALGAGLAILVPTRSMFYIAAVIIGVGLGPNQSASRTLMARLVDPSRATAFFGLYALSGKATVWLGPMLFSVLRSAGYSQRVAFLPLVVMFVIGFVVMTTVRMPQSAMPERVE